MTGEPASLRDDLRAAFAQLVAARERAEREGATEVCQALAHAIPWTHTARTKAYYFERDRGS